MNKNNLILLSLLKSASILQKNTLILPLKKSNINLLILLYKQGLIQNFTFLSNNFFKHPKILIRLRFFFNKSIFKNFKLLSKPGLYLYLTFEEICLLYDKRNVIYFSTINGLLTQFECKKQKIGGIALFKC